MWDKVKSALSSLLEPEGGAAPQSDESVIQLASVALMVEVVAADYENKPEERAALIAGIQRSFGQGEQEATELLVRAEQAHAGATDYFRFTSQINQVCSQAEKVQLIENLWRVAFADGELHHVEEHVIRRIADLIHVPHMDFIAAKHRAEAEQ
ncbi:MAG: hypothetical protein CMI01_16355 [Oceanospirillaceae bacterium]|nr:hypothetical protein [Oceanospirillaceae bacterium]